MGQNTSNSVWKPCEDLQKTFDLCHCQQRVYNKVLRWNFVIDQILIFHHNLQINSLKILQCDFLDFFSFLILSLIVEVYLWWKLQASLIFFKWKNLHNWWLTKYVFAPLCVCMCIYIYDQMYSNIRITINSWWQSWFFTAIISVFSVTGSFRNHSDLVLNKYFKWLILTNKGCKSIVHYLINISEKFSGYEKPEYFIWFYYDDICER